MFDTPLRVLLIEDDLGDALLVSRRLERELGSLDEVRLDRAGTLQEGIDRLGKKECDVVLLDLHLPDSAGTETVRRLRAADPDVPIVVFTSAGEGEVPVRALKAGAHDYLGKNDFETGPVLHRSLRYAIERSRIERDRARLQQELDEAERLQGLGVLAAGAAFGFNQLIGSFLDRTDEALEALGKALANDHSRRHLIAAREDALQAIDLAAQLREYARADRVPSRALNLSEFVRGERRQLEVMAGPEIEIACELDDGVPSVRANPLDLRQLLVNLVVNAIEAIGAGPGRILLSTGRTWADRERLAAGRGAPDLPEGPYASLQVADTGAGLDPQTLGRIYDPFFTTKFAGRGLGLAAALAIVRRHRAWIGATNADAGGACFEILLPPVL